MPNLEVGKAQNLISEKVVISMKSRKVDSYSQILDSNCTFSTASVKIFGLSQSMRNVCLHSVLPASYQLLN